jgi:NitT/TauT family transport system substrate-binding protein
VIALALFSTGSRYAHAATDVRFSFDRPLDGTMAPFIVAMTQGLFHDEDVAVTIAAAGGSQDAILRVASGANDMALADLNALIRFRDGDKAGAAPVKAAFVLFDQAPYAVIARRNRGINSIGDMEGKTLGVADGDLAIRLWPALARKNNIDTAKVKIEKISAAVREPILSAGQVDAVTGFSYLSAINLKDRGIPAGDLAVLRFSDFGCEAYGQVLIVNAAFAAEHPDAVRGFIRALIAGIRLAEKQPERAIDDVVAQMDGASRDLELERLRTALRDNILTENVRENGMGAIDTARFNASLEDIAVDFEFHKHLTIHDIFDDSFLPPQSQRKLY